ncbi:MAG: hypothetical protein H6725_16020 [Sandaracinaceae bacterium]|nr:hypothetical protein [Sandaracinaceae bacterium]
MRDGSVLPGDGGVSPRPNGPPRLPAADRIVELPYMAPAQLVAFTLTATPAQLDVHFSVDTTGSFGAEIDAMQRDLEERLIPEIRARVADSAFGVSRFEDFPIHPFGDQADLPFRLLSPVTTDVARVRAGVDDLDRPLGSGGDIAEAGFEALFQIASGAGLTSAGREWIAPFAGTGLGGVGFREGALHAIVHITDAPAHAASDYGAAVADAHSEADARAALAELPAFVLAAVGSAEARSSLQALVVGSGAVVPPVGGQCLTGLNGAARPPEGGQCPLLFDIASDGTGLSDAILDAITGLVETLSYRHVRAEFDTDRLGFIESFEATSATALMGVTPPTRVDSPPTDGVFDAFEDVRGGTELVFTLRLRNVLLRDLDYEQAFRITVRIVGDGVVLAEQTLRIVVPAVSPEGAGDAGPADAGPLDGGVSGDGGP